MATTCEHCGSPLLSINGQDQCGRCDTPRAQGVNLERRPQPLPTQPERTQQQYDAEQATIHTAKLAAAEAFTEVRELIGDVKAARLAGQLRDSAKSAQYLATTAGILTDKALLLEGRPTSIHQSQDAEDTWAHIAKQLGYVDTTGEEITEGDQ